MKFFFLFFLCIFSYCSKAQSLEVSDFYENGQLIEVRDPPYFNYNYNRCEYHILNAAKPLSFDHPYEVINHWATSSLEDAVKVCWLQDIPPPYYWNRKCRIKGKMGAFLGFFSRYSPNFKRGSQEWPWINNIEYSEYVQKYAYLYYWFHLSYDLMNRGLNRKLTAKENELRDLEERNISGMKVRDLKEDIDFLRGEIQKIPTYKVQSIEYINKSYEKITDLFLKIYDNCIRVHQHPTAIYERGRICFDRGDTEGFVNDIFTLIEMGHEATPEVNFELGKAYNDANLFNHAIKILSEVIQKKPQLKEAYFERAIAYFETGNLQLSLEDYLNYGIRPTFLKDHDHKHFLFSVGLGLGCVKGGFDSAIHFVPSLLSTEYGLGKGLWALSSDPIGVSKELIEETFNCIEFIRNNLSSELLVALVPELQECIQIWDQLDEEKKGYYLGYVIGRYGIDALICGASTRAIQVYRNLKRANTLLTLETASLSQSNADALAKASEEYFIFRQEYKKKCKLHIGQQEKHILGSNNFEVGKGELIISVEHLEEIIPIKLGEGIPTRFTFGEAGYKEVVEFDEIIGIHVVEKTGERFPTPIGEIHYNKNGEFHVVPVSPDKLKRLKK